MHGSSRVMRLFSPDISHRGTGRPQPKRQELNRKSGKAGKIRTDDFPIFPSSLFETVPCEIVGRRNDPDGYGHTFSEDFFATEDTEVEPEYTEPNSLSCSVSSVTNALAGLGVIFPG